MSIITQNRKKQYYHEIQKLLKKNRLGQIEFASMLGIEVGRIKNIMRGAGEWKLSEMYTVLDLFHKNERDLPILFPRNKVQTELPDPKDDWRYHI